MYVYCHILLKHYIIIQYIGKNLMFRKEVILRHVLIGAWRCNYPPFNRQTNQPTEQRAGVRGQRVVILLINNNIQENLCMFNDITFLQDYLHPRMAQLVPIIFLFNLTFKMSTRSKLVFTPFIVGDEEVERIKALIFLQSVRFCPRIESAYCLFHLKDMHYCPPYSEMSRFRINMP